DGTLDVLDGDGRGVDPEDTGTFARGGADAPGEFREIVGLVKPVERFTPKTAINQIVPLRDQVVDRAAGRHTVEQSARMTEGDAAIHAAGRLLPQPGGLQVEVKLVPVAHALCRRAIGGEFAEVFDE